MAKKETEEQKPEAEEQKTVVVWITTHDHFRHSASGVVFEATKVRDGDQTYFLGRAEVPADVAEKHFASHPSFRIEE